MGAALLPGAALFNNEEKMDHTQELQKALQELRRITGITLDVSTESPEQAEHALAQIRCLCTAYKEKYNKTDFLQSLLTGGCRRMMSMTAPPAFI